MAGIRITNWAIVQTKNLISKKALDYTMVGFNNRRVNNFLELKLLHSLYINPY